MIDPGSPQREDIQFDRNNLYREESYTDLKTGSIRKLVPVSLDGSEDAGRQPMFLGYAQLMSPQGPLPVQCQIPAASLEEAIDRFPQALQQAVMKLMEEVKAAQQKESSRIVVPGMGLK